MCLTTDGFTIFAILWCLGFLFSGWLVVSLFVRPKTFWRYFDSELDPRPYLRGQTPSEGMLFLMPFVAFVGFGKGTRSMYWLVSISSIPMLSLAPFHNIIPRRFQSLYWRTPPKSTTIHPNL